MKGRPDNPPTLFAARGERQTLREAPLATRMRPASLTEMVGHESLLGEGRVLRRAIDSGQLPSMILWGPPGSGKTTLAHLIAGRSHSHFAPVSAVGAGVAELRRIIEEARERRGVEERRTILFIDEIHRFNKAQQDVVLPHVEEGVVTLIGATTENPSFEVVPPLLSRCRVFTLKALSPEEIAILLRRALDDNERGLGRLRADVDEETLSSLARAAAGDARVALNALELATVTKSPENSGRRSIETADLMEALQRRTAYYDKKGDNHYDVISAFIKSVRGSDPDAALYWLARMLEGGEEPLFIARRLVILAAEDIGLADPQALVVTTAAQQAVHFVGMPEGFYHLAEATIFLATAPKSRSVGDAYGRALKDAQATPDEPVPLHLRNIPSYAAAKGEDDPQDDPGISRPDHASKNGFTPEPLSGRRYYLPGDKGHEPLIAEQLQQAGRSEKSSEGTINQPG